ncbi:RNA-directed DNA polymerase from transposon x-element [Paraphaeosphaeria minitans]|uniref:RNA-directed DNA polymerase from transposon x-element n=1 Tax=Paraphaeosphaeria minitans TaxID=565426 RepID=A0A9P6G4E4_9PLEO|nr:RNA-directed DNA polymerase from transposon x-element [Paraphaeosphaeria minitans]
MTYIRKGYHLRLQTRESLNHPDLLWVVVNGVAILNCYRQPLTPDVLQYVTHLTPPQHCLVGGDFNVRHESFEPAVTAANGGIELARWAAAASMDYIGVPGQPTHCAGHVLDLTFSNIPFAQSAVEASMHSGSDHETIVTSIPTSALGTPHLAQYHYRVPEASLPKFAGLIEIGVQGIPDPLAAQDTAQLDNSSSLRKATIACVYPSLLHGTECWYRGRTKPPRTLKPGRPPEVSAYVGWHIAAIDKTIAIAARGILPVWRTTPTATLFRDAGLPSAAVALEEAKLRYATHLRAIDSDHLLTNRAVVPIVNRGKGAGKPQRIQTKPLTTRLDAEPTQHSA